MQTVSVMLNTALGAGRNAAINVEYTGILPFIQLILSHLSLSLSQVMILVSVCKPTARHLVMEKQVFKSL